MVIEPCPKNIRHLLGYTPSFAARIVQISKHSETGLLRDTGDLF